MSHHHHDKKHKKLLQFLRNRHALRINQQAEVHERNRELDREREEEMREAALASSRKAEKTDGQGKPVWSAKMQEIRNKNTGRKQMAADRWNRFAGTEGGGGRGR